MSRRALTAALVVTLSLSTACAPALVPGTPGPGSPATPTTQPASWVGSMLSAVNAERTAVGAAPLSLCNTLATAASNHSADQAATGVMSHTGSNGSTLSQRAQAAGYDGWTALGENVAYGQQSVTAVMAAWMASPPHRSSLLSTTFTHVGFGQAGGAFGVPYWTQVFGTNGSC